VISLDQRPDGVVIPLRVRAGARRTGIAGEHGGALRVDVTAAPEKGKANRAVLDVLSEALGVAKSHMTIVSGDTSPQKRVLVAGFTVNEVQRVLEARLGSKHQERDDQA
jgi:uncharacterized protein (TIGR00251 family)